MIKRTNPSPIWFVVLLALLLMGGLTWCADSMRKQEDSQIQAMPCVLVQPEIPRTEVTKL